MNEPIISITTKTASLAESEDVAHMPLLHVYLLGAFRLCWQVPPMTNEALWNSRTAARTLLKLLLCAPGRQASKRMLAGILWPETSEGKARESLRQASNVLRKMLCTASGENLLEQRNDGEHLKLAEQGRLWVDVDAFDALVAEASRAMRADEALAFWQEAYGMLSGELLADDQDSEWVRHGWVKRRKQLLWLARCRLIRHLSDLYMQQGQISLAEEMLEQHLTRFPADQDALYRLLTLLQQEGCFEQASVLYEQSRRVLEGGGKQPAKHVRALYERLLKAAHAATQPIADGLAYGQQLATSTAHQHELVGKRPGKERQETVNPPLPHISFTHGQAKVIDTLNITSDSSPEQQLGIWLTLGAQGLSPLFDAGWTIENTLDSLQVVLQGVQGIPMMTRRQLLQLGATAFVSGIPIPLPDKHVTEEERIRLCQALGDSIAGGWKQFYSISNAQVLAIAHAQLFLVQQSHALLYPQVRCICYAGVYGQIGIARHFQERDEEALQACHCSYIAALEAGEPWYVVQSLICQADSYHALRQYDRAIQAIEEALRIIGKPIDATMIRAKAHLLACWADNAMMLNDHAVVQKMFDTSEAYLDQIVSNEEFDRASWLLIVGKYALKTKDYITAKYCFEQALTELPEQWTLRRAMTATGLAMTYARLRERDCSLTTAKDLIGMISTVDTQMTNRWFTEYLQHDLLEIFPTDIKVHRFVADASHQLPQLASPPLLKK